MAGIKALRQIQLGRETTAGTAVNCTTLWRGKGVLDDQRELTFPEEDIGYLSGVDRSYIAKLYGVIGLESVEATFEQTPHIFDMSIGNATPVQDGSGSGYIRTYTFPTTQANTIKTYTIRGGDNQQAEIMSYAFGVDFTLEGDSGAAWMISANLGGRTVDNGSFNAGIALPAVEDMLFLKSKLYIDAVGGSFGSTLKSNTFLSARLQYTSGLIPKFTADGELYFSFLQTTPPEALLTITFEHEGSSVTEKGNWRTQTPRLIRILTEGNSFTTAGSTYSRKTQIIDLAGKWERFEPLGDRDGNDIIEATFRARYNATVGTMGKIINVNTLSALP